MASRFFIYCVALILLIVFDNGAGQLLISDEHQVKQCESICSTAFDNSKATNQRVCSRGCRLLSLLDVMDGESNSIDEIRSSCLQSCKKSYTDGDNEAACAFGCQSQIPIVEKRRKEMPKFIDNDLNSWMSTWSNVQDYYRRMMDCLSDQFRHNMRISWYEYGPLTSSNDNEQLTVVIGTSNIDNVAPIQDVVIEQKTQNYLETNLAVVDRSATANLHASQVDSNIVAAESAASSSIVKSQKDDWLFCLEKRASATKKMLSVMAGVSLIAIIYFCISALLPSSNHSSTSGGVAVDIDYLPYKIDEDLAVKTTKCQEKCNDMPSIVLQMPVEKI